VTVVPRDGTALSAALRLPPLARLSDRQGLSPAYRPCRLPIAAWACCCLVALSHVHIKLFVSLMPRPAAARPPLSIFQPRQPFLHILLYPLVGMATAQANGRGNVGDRHPVGQE